METRSGITTLLNPFRPQLPGPIYASLLGHAATMLGAALAVALGAPIWLGVALCLPGVLATLYVQRRAAEEAGVHGLVDTPTDKPNQITALAGALLLLAAITGLIEQRMVILFVPALLLVEDVALRAVVRTRSEAPRAADR